MREQKKRTIRRMERYGILLFSVVVLLRIGRNSFIEEGSIFLWKESHSHAQKLYLPLFSYQKEQNTGKENVLKKQLRLWIPLAEYLEDQAGQEESGEVLEDEETIAWILQCQANDEHAVDADGNLIDAETPVQDSIAEQPVPGIDLSLDRLRDFEYLTSNFYTIDSSTMIGPEQLNADDLLSHNMKIDQNTGGPKILIFHTHSQEEFADSTPGDPATSIVGVGEYLTQLLNAEGIETIHDSGIYDIINGKLDRSRAYENAESAIRPILESNPSIEVAIDLHRDGVNAETHLVTEVNGKPTAKIMYFNGLSRTRTNGDIAYLYNPYIQDNLAFSLQMQIASEQYYPGFARHIYLKAYRYNLHLLPKSLLIEAGAQTNTVEEMKNAMEVLGRTLKRVLTE